MEQNSAPIGVFDSGVGGLSVLRHLLRLMPDERYIYLGDSARVPYGSKSPQTVQLFARQCTQFLLNQGVKLIVVACNTASAVALDAVQSISPVPVVGMILPAAQAALAATRNGQIGVIGTRATINSTAYPQAILARERVALQAQAVGNLDELPHRIQVNSQACPLFVPLVEEGWTDHPAARLVAQDYLAPLRMDWEGMDTGGMDTLVLGCTHYPLLAPLLADLLPGVSLIDCGEHAAWDARCILENAGGLAAPAPSSAGNGVGNGTAPPADLRFFLTDIPTTFQDVAQRFLGFPIPTPQRVSIDHLCLDT